MAAETSLLSSLSQNQSQMLLHLLGNIKKKKQLHQSIKLRQELQRRWGRESVWGEGTGACWEFKTAGQCLVLSHWFELWHNLQQLQLFWQWSHIITKKSNCHTLFGKSLSICEQIKTQLCTFSEIRCYFHFPIFLFLSHLIGWKPV